MKHQLTGYIRRYSDRCPKFELYSDAMTPLDWSLFAPGRDGKRSKRAEHVPDLNVLRCAALPTSRSDTVARATAMFDA